MDKTAIQYMGLIMRQSKLDMQYALSMVDVINNSYLNAKDVVTVLEEIFRNEKSGKILVAVQVLDFLIKNCNRNFHQAANRESFQKSLLGLLKRLRGKSSLIKDLRSNSENWSRIESKVLYLIQLWYDAFILEESKYPYIINNYKILRQENVIFPPRNVNEKSLLAVQTESPIFDNIETIAQTDKQKFKKRLKAMGMTELSERFERKERMQANTPKGPPRQRQNGPSRQREINIDDISEKMAIIQSQNYEAADALKVIEQIKAAIQFGKVKPAEQGYWQELKVAADVMVQEWEEKNAEVIKREEERYLEAKMGKINRPEAKQEEAEKKEPAKNSNLFDLLDDLEEEQANQIALEQKPTMEDKPTLEYNLLDM